MLGWFEMLPWAWVRVVWIIATIVNAASAVWFILGETGNFQWSLDFPERIALFIIWIPSIVLVILSTILLSRKWVPKGSTGYAALLIIIIFHFSFSIPIFVDVKTQGWLYDL